ncbi:MAG: hypothetical protein DMF29_09850 [Verrucomicrobia bacterium]|nr:MAG: hypothetical protein DMF29_09850 [Verrucomicrobiota bacterium]
MPISVFGVGAKFSGRDSTNDCLIRALDKMQSWILSIPVTLLADRVLRSYSKSVGQQHRVRSKRKRRQAYLKRKKKTTRSKQRESPRQRSRKEPAAPE